MAKRNTSIQINGKRYDAITGSLLVRPTVPAHSGKSIDGVVGAAKSTGAITQPSRALPASAVPRSRAAHAKSHQATPSATLMRHVVSKPSTASLKRRGKVQASTLSKASPAVVRHFSTPSLQKTHAGRLARAAKVDISPRIARFAHQITTSTPVLFERAVNELDANVSVPSLPTTQTYRVEVTPRNARRVTNDIFEQALARATSHEEPAPNPATKRGKRAKALRKHMMKYGAAALVILVIAGVAGQQIDNIKFKLAANRAGFAATMPSYRPAGFTLAKVQVQSGYFGLNFTNSAEPNGLSHSFAVTERPSPWNSQTLLTNILASANVNGYNSIQTAGRTVYVYGQNQAAWVNDGILYQVLGNGLLTTQEFSQLAASM